MKKTTLIAMLSIGMLFGCTKPTEVVIPSDMSTWDEKLAPVVKKLSEEDQKKLSGYLIRAKMGEVLGGKGVPPATTIAMAIESQDKWEAEQAAQRAEEAALKAKLEAERAAAVERLNKTVTVTLVKKEQRARNYREERYSDSQVFRIGIRNNSDKEIIGVSGELKFIDIFDKEVGAVNFRASEKIAPGKSVTWTGSRDYNQFIDSHRSVWNLEDGKYTTRFVPETVVFADGTKLGVVD